MDGGSYGLECAEEALDSHLSEVVVDLGWPKGVGKDGWACEVVMRALAHTNNQASAALKVNKDASVFSLVPAHAHIVVLSGDGRYALPGSTSSRR